MLRVAVCVSGGGTNLQAILDKIRDGAVTNTEIAVVVSNNPGAYALERARAAHVPAVCVSPKEHASREEFNTALVDTLEQYRVDLVDEGTDTGPIILQKAVAVEDGDTPEILQRRVMEQAEWEILPEAIDLIANGRIQVKDGRVIRQKG